MTQNTEQNSAFRTREAQEDSLTYHLGGLQAARNFRLLARAVIQEAEARGAEEQRRKDAKGQTTIVFQRYIPGHGWDDIDERRVAAFKRRGFETRTLYTRPANVAALEVRIASLTEAEQLARADAEASKARATVLEEEKNHEFNRGYLIACCNVANMHDEPAIACDVLAEGDLTEDDIEAAKLAEYDATALLEIRQARGDQDPIRAALTRKGGV